MLPAQMSSKTSDGDIVTHITSLCGDPSLNPWMFCMFFIRFGLPAFSGVLDEHQIHSKSLHLLIADCEQFLVFIIKHKLRFFTANSPCLYHFLHCYDRTTSLMQIRQTALFIFLSFPHTVAHVRYDLATSRRHPMYDTIWWPLSSCLVRYQSRSHSHYDT